jgi:hypothetical protein
MNMLNSCIILWLCDNGGYTEEKWRGCTIPPSLPTHTHKLYTQLYLAFIYVRQVDVTQRTSVHSDPVFVRSLNKGNYFGEKALKGWVENRNFTWNINKINKSRICIELNEYSPILFTKSCENNWVLLHRWIVEKLKKKTLLKFTG